MQITELRSNSRPRRNLLWENKQWWDQMSIFFQWQIHSLVNQVLARGWKIIMEEILWQRAAEYSVEWNGQMWRISARELQAMYCRKMAYCWKDSDRCYGCLDIKTHSHRCNLFFLKRRRIEEIWRTREIAMVHVIWPTIFIIYL